MFWGVGAGWGRSRGGDVRGREAMGGEPTSERGLAVGGVGRRAVGGLDWEITESCEAVVRGWSDRPSGRPDARLWAEGRAVVATPRLALAEDRPSIKVNSIGAALGVTLTGCTQ